MKTCPQMDVVRCRSCGGIVRIIPPGQAARPGPGERCGDLEYLEGRFDLYERLRRDCLARRRGDRSVGVQYALPGQQTVQPEVIRRRRRKETR